MNHFGDSTVHVTVRLPSGTRRLPRLLLEHPLTSGGVADLQYDRESVQTRVAGCRVTHAGRHGNIIFYGVERPDGTIRWLFTRNAADRKVRLGGPAPGETLDLVWRL